MNNQPELQPESSAEPASPKGAASPEPANAPQESASAQEQPASGQNDLALPSADQLGRLIQHPMVNKYLGKATKIVAVCAISGCILMVVAITAVCNLFNQILSNLGSH